MPAEAAARGGGDGPPDPIRRAAAPIRRRLPALARLHSHCRLRPPGINVTDRANCEDTVEGGFRMAKEALRPDVEAARSRMKLKFGAGKEINALSARLSDDEKVEAMAAGKYHNKDQGLVVLTDRRLFFLTIGIGIFGKESSEDFPLEKVSSVRWQGGIGSGTVTIVASGGGAEIKSVIVADGRALVDAARARLSAPRVATTKPIDDPMDQLRKLGELRDAGILTTDEFDAKKADLLGRL